MYMSSFGILLRTFSKSDIFPDEVCTHDWTGDPSMKCDLQSEVLSEVGRLMIVELMALIPNREHRRGSFVLQSYIHWEYVSKC